LVSTQEPNLTGFRKEMTEKKMTILKFQNLEVWNSQPGKERKGREYQLNLSLFRVQVCYCHQSSLRKKRKGYLKNI